MNDFSQSHIEKVYAELLEFVGEDPTREGLLKTPQRAAEAMRFLTKGYNTDMNALLNGAVFSEPYQDMVIVKDIEFYSLCEHHLLPFFGRCHVAYLPDGKIIGLSKIPRIVEAFSRRLQVQERLTVQIAEALEEALHPKGIAVVTKAQHLCMMARGVEKQDSKVIASEMRGLFRSDRGSRLEFLDLIGLHREVL